MDTRYTVQVEWTHSRTGRKITDRLAYNLTSDEAFTLVLNATGRYDAAYAVPCAAHAFQVGPDVQPTR